MLLFKVPEQVYQDLMAIYHYDMPLEQEATIRENVERKQEYDSSGRKLGSVEGDFGNLGKSSAQPTSFIS
jgi:hypothetical protein